MTDNIIMGVSARGVKEMFTRPRGVVVLKAKVGGLHLVRNPCLAEDGLRCQFHKVIAKLLATRARYIVKKNV